MDRDPDGRRPRCIRVAGRLHGSTKDEDKGKSTSSEGVDVEASSGWMILAIEREGWAVMVVQSGPRTVETVVEVKDVLSGGRGGDC
jgi:hypothetical protein